MGWVGRGGMSGVALGLGRRGGCLWGSGLMRGEENFAPRVGWEVGVSLGGVVSGVLIDGVCAWESAAGLRGREAGRWGCEEAWCA